MPVWFSVAVLACSGVGGGDTASAEPPICEVADATASCPSCSDGPWTCVFGDTRVVEGSCGECQVVHALAVALCESGETASVEQIEAERVCEPVTCEVFADCCTVSCLAAHEVPEPSSDCTLTCTDGAEEPPGDCVWQGDRCDWALPATP